MLKRYLIILSLNFFFIILLFYIILFLFEKNIKLKNNNFPSELRETRKFNNGYTLSDGKKNIFRKSVKLENVSYYHNKYGFRINSLFSMSEVYKNDSVFAIGDSTSYGLNINAQDTFINIVAANLQSKEYFNLSFPGIDIVGINAKAECLTRLISKTNGKHKLLVIGIFFNDFKNSALVDYKINRQICSVEGLKALNLNNTPFEMIGLPQKQIVNRTFVERVLRYIVKVHFKYMPNMMLVMNRFVYKHFKVSSQLFKIFHPEDYLRFKTQEDFTNIVNEEKYLWHLNKFKSNINELSAYFNDIVVIHIPRDEEEILIDSEEMIGGKGISSKFFSDLQEINNRHNIHFINGAKLIYSSLSKDLALKLKAAGRLPIKYYSFLPSYDLGHPSVFVSKLYADEIIKNIKSQ